MVVKDSEPKEWEPGQAHPENELKRIRTAKGHRPYFFDDPSVDKLLAIMLAMASELSAVRDRLDTHERLAASKKWPTHKAIEDYKLDDDAYSYRNQSREEFIGRLMRVMQVELDNISREEAEKKYRDIVKEISK